MQYSLAFLVLATAVSGSPMPQGVTAALPPSGSAPEGCMPAYVGSFGLVVSNITDPTAAARRQVGELPDGQPQVHVMGVVSIITDGQLQAPYQTVSVAPSPYQCQAVTQIGDGQAQGSVPIGDCPMQGSTLGFIVSQIDDGQIQGPVVTSAGGSPAPCPGDCQTGCIDDCPNQCPGSCYVHGSAVTQIGDGQIQGPVATPIETSPYQCPAVTEIGDGQAQGPIETGACSYPYPPSSTVTQIRDGKSQGRVAPRGLPVVTQIGDGQVQAPIITLAPPVTEYFDGQLEAPYVSLIPISQIADAQPQAPVATPLGKVNRDVNAASSPTTGIAACSSPGTLELTLIDGVLTDSKGRTGYIASNYQFQFDSPPQAGAMITTGFSSCADETLALGGSTTFWQCRSGDFYNIYDRNWAPQCNAIHLNMAKLVNCAT